MKRTASLLLALLGVAVWAEAQTVIPTTVLQQETGANTPFIVLAAGASVSVGDQVYVFDGQPEGMSVTSVNGVRVGVRRGYGTPANSHAAGALVYYGAESLYTNTDVVPGADCSGATNVPSINTRTGQVAQCVDALWNVVTPGTLPHTGTGPMVLGVNPRFTADLIFEGATDDDIEVILEVPDPTTTDVTVTLGDTTATYMQGPTVANAVDTIFFIADRLYLVTDVSVVWTTAETTGAMDVMVERLQATEALGSGDDLLAAVVDATGTANTVAEPALTGTAALLQLEAGDRLAVELTATPNEIAGLTVTVGLQAR